MEIAVGPVAARLLLGFRHAVATLARAGNDLIVDDVLLGDARRDYDLALAGLPAVWVGVMASLATLELRETRRGDRRRGLARWQFHRVHRGLAYDLEVDAERDAPEDCARLIRDTFDL